MPSPDPSALAQRLLGAEGTRLYLEVGRELGLDWSVLAAADQPKGAAGGPEVGERTGFASEEATLLAGESPLRVQGLLLAGMVHRGARRAR